MHGLTRRQLVALLAASTILHAAPALAGEKHYAPGITDTEIKIGQTNPYSGPTSMWSANGRADQAFFKMINDRGGVNGRKIVLISLDDGYSPPKTLEQTRKLVEEDGVAFIYRSLGTPTNSAIAKYLNDHHVPQLLIASGPSKWNDPEHLPWTMSSMLSYQTEARLYGHYVLKERPNAKIAVLYQNDDLGKDFLKGLSGALGDKAGSMIVKTLSYEVTDPTVDSQVVQLKESGADTLFLFSASKPSAQAIRKAYELGWKPQIVMASFSANIGQTLTPAGLDKSVGIITAQSFKDPNDPQWTDDPEYKAWRAWMDQYAPTAEKNDASYVNAYAVGTLLVTILKRCGDDLSRENIMREAAHLDHVRLPMFLPDVTASTSPADFRPLKQARLVQFDGTRFVPVGALLTD
jgi:branched-chain amino acid transport system substrate-binding protein